jgi:HTH-type transcriptional regulator/antitoxin HigA
MLEPVHDQKTHRKALRRIEELWDTEPGSPEGRELDALATLVDAYERRQFPILPPEPVEAIRARCEQLGWTRRDLEPLIGSRARVSEILGRQRSLTLPMIRRLHAALGIPAELLVARATESRRRGRSTAAKRPATIRPAKKRTARPKKPTKRTANRRQSNSR